MTSRSGPGPPVSARAETATRPGARAWLSTFWSRLEKTWVSRTGSPSRVAGRSGSKPRASSNPARASLPSHSSRVSARTLRGAVSVRLWENPPGLGQGELVEVLHDLGEVDRLGVERGQGLGVGLAQSVLDGLDLADEDRERGPQLVGDIGEPLLLAFLVAAQLPGQGVELPGQKPQLVARGDLDAGLEAALAQAPGGPGQAAEGGR